MKYNTIDDEYKNASIYDLVTITIDDIEEDTIEEEE